MFRVLLLITAVIGASAGTPTQKNNRSLNSTFEPSLPSPLAPKNDPFYSAPPGFESTQPGSILRVRRAPYNLADTFNASSAAYNIVYRTTNSRYKAAWAVTTVFIPYETRNSSSGTSSLLSYQIPYNTADINGSPSYLLASSYAAALVLSDVQTALSQGSYVNIPDFEGPTASFASGVSEGHAVIDSIRAALTFTPAAKTALWGYSGGSLASEWAAELANQYAPEIQFSGMAIGGVVANTTDVLSRIDGTPAAWLVPSVVLGLTNQYPDASEYLLSSLKKTGPSNQTGFLATEDYGYPQNLAAYGNHSVLNDYFVNGNSTVFDSPIIRRILNTDGQMGYHGVPSMPMYVYKAVKDEYSAIEYTDALVQRYCEVGANITYKRNLRGNHLDEYTNGDAGALAWLMGVLNNGNVPYNASVQSGCSLENVTVGTEDHEPFYLPPV